MCKEYEEVDHPQHYGGSDFLYEAKKVIRALGLDFFTGNAFKYIARAGKKPGQDEIKDLNKAIWYLQDKVRHLETGEL